MSVLLFIAVIIMSVSHRHVRFSQEVISLSLSLSLCSITVQGSNLPSPKYHIKNKNKKSIWEISICWPMVNPTSHLSFPKFVYCNFGFHFELNTFEFVWDLIWGQCAMFTHQNGPRLHYALSSRVVSKFSYHLLCLCIYAIKISSHLHKFLIRYW